MDRQAIQPSQGPETQTPKGLNGQGTALALRALPYCVGTASHQNEDLNITSFQTCFCERNVVVSEIQDGQAREDYHLTGWRNDDQRIGMEYLRIWRLKAVSDALRDTRAVNSRTKRLKKR